MNILILSPHTDDGEFGCGGSIAKLIAHGSVVLYVAFSSAEKSVPAGFPKDVLKIEVKKAIDILGVLPANLKLFDYNVREFPSHRQAILDDIVQLKQDFAPDLVILPSTHDTHQDHQVIAQEGFRVFKDVSIWGYEVPRNNMSFPTSVFIQISAEELEFKIEAIKCYRSQADRPSSFPDFIKSLARVRGTQIGVRYAEAFEGIRWVMR